MKKVERNILPFQEKIFFSPIRGKKDYVKVLAISARLLLFEDDYSEGVQVNSKMKLIIDKMSRIFFYNENKYFSVSFPFSVQIEENIVTEITTYSGKKLDNKSISSIISIIDSEEFKLNPSLIDTYIEPNSIDNSDISLLEEIFQFEPAYIRFDSNPERENGKLHPLHHLDVNYSNQGTFKLGLNNHITTTDFENILDTQTECSYIQ